MLISGLLSWSFDNRILGDIVGPLLPGRHPALRHDVRRPRRHPRRAAAAPAAVDEPGPRPAHPRHHRASSFLVWVLGSIAVQDRRPDQPQRGWLGRAGRRRAHHRGRPLSPDVDIDVRTWPTAEQHASRSSSSSCSWRSLLFAVAYTLNIQDGVIFASFLVAIIGMVGGLLGTGFGGYLGFIAANNRRPLLLAAFLVAFLFPFTQNGSDANMSIATQILIFAATALGLNIVVGLAGLLDLGYIAFLGTGAYVGAMLSSSAFSTVGWHPPFVVVMLVGAATAATFGLIIGTPTLRVSGDYLAIVTLGFGEIFRHRDVQPRRQQRPRPHQRAQRHPGHPRPGLLRVRLRRGAHPRRHPARPVQQLLLPAAPAARCSSSSSSSGSTTAGSGAAGSPSARTSGPPRPWASTSSA